MNSSEKIIALGTVTVGPFVVGAALEFLPTWLSFPMTFVVSIFWLGTMGQIAEYKRSEDND